MNLQRMLTNTLIIAVCILINALNVVAEVEVPPYINYQGTLTDKDGKPLANGQYTLKFSVYDSTDGEASPVWGPQVFDGTTGLGHGALVQVVNGAFNVILGPEDTNGRPLTGAFSAGTTFLGITVGDGAEITPRQAILSAPYALSAPLPRFAIKRVQDWDAASTCAAVLVPDSEAKLKIRAGSLVRARFQGTWFNVASTGEDLQNNQYVEIILYQNESIIAQVGISALQYAQPSGGPFGRETMVGEAYSAPFDEDIEVRTEVHIVNCNTRNVTTQWRSMVITLEEVLEAQHD